MGLRYLIIFLSGFAALSFEIIWIRQLTLVLGNTTASISLVVAAFMAGLALGSAILGRWVDRRRHFLSIYALLELGIAVSGVAVVAVIPMLETLYPQLASVAATRTDLLGLLRFGLSFAVLLVPTGLMGGTFPVLVKALATDFHRLGAVTGRLYAANTIGGVAGCFCTGTFLIGELGLSHTAYVAAGLNVLSALLAVPLARAMRRQTKRPASAAGRDTAPVEPSTAHTPIRRVVCVAVGLSGCLALGYEIVWSRSLSLLLGHSIYAFTFVLSTYLTGLAIGGWLAAPLLDRIQRPHVWFVAGLLLLAPIAGATLYVIPLLPFRGYAIGAAPVPYILGNFLCTGLLLLPPTLVLGALLPMAIKICTANLSRTGRHVGTVYAWNTVGSIAGSLLTGFLLIPYLGTQPAFMLLVLGNLVLAFALGWRVGWPRPWRFAAGGLIALGGVALWASIGSPIFRSTAIARMEHTLGPVEVFYFDEDQVTLVGLCRDRHGSTFLFTGGQVMTHLGLETLWMAHLPMAHLEEPGDVLALCLGMGNTFVAASQYPVKVTAVELSPKVVEAAHVLHGQHMKVDTNSRILVADARNTVLVTPEQFDVITVDPPPPLYSAGTVNFHTAEFYRLCRERLRPGGVMCQWIPFRSCTVEEYRTLMRTFRSVFQRMMVWIPSPTRGVSGAFLLGLGPQVRLDWERIHKRLSSPIVAADVRRLTNVPLDRLQPLAIMTGSDVGFFCGQGPILTDDHPSIEYPLFRNAGQREPMTFKPLYEYLKRAGMVRSAPLRP